MNFRNLFGLLLLIIGCAGIIGLSLGTTDTIRIAGPLNFSYFDHVWYVGIAIVIFGVIIWSAMYFLNRWAAASGIICLTTGIGALIVCLIRLGNLSEEVLHSSDGRYAPASPVTYGACILPAVVLLAVGYWRLVHYNLNPRSPTSHGCQPPISY